MRYGLLGPLCVINGSDQTVINSHKIEILFATLLIRADHIVTIDQLIEEIWSGRPPERATAVLYVYISELRKFLRAHGLREQSIATRSPGYMLQPENDDEIDFQVFLDLLEMGRKSARACQHEDAIKSFEHALSQWRGPVLSNFGDGPIISGFATELMERRVECLEMTIESQIQLGRHRETVSRLYSLIAENPLHETFYRQLMVALYRSERKADALRVYQSARKTLNDELGLEPCRTLQNTQRAVLLDDDRLLQVGR